MASNTKVIIAAFVASLLAPEAWAGSCDDALSIVSARYPSAPLVLLKAIVKTESGGNPWAVNLDGNAYNFATSGEAVQFVRSAEKAAKRNIDVGCMQLNLANHKQNFASIEDMFDPTSNIAYGTRFLIKLRAISPDWTNATAKYTNQRNRPIQMRYVCNVLKQLNSLQGTNHTASFCA